MNTKLNTRFGGLFLLTVIAFVLLSPKWLFAPAAWIAPALLLSLVSRVKFWYGALWAWLALFFSGLIANKGVLPFPGIFFYIMIVFISLIKVIPYILSNWLALRSGIGWISTLIFPCALVVSEYLDSFGGGGTWGSLANTQFENYHLIQVASLGGIWCITFLIGWFASTLNWMMQQEFRWKTLQKPVVIYSGVFAGCLIYGTIQTNPFDMPEQDTVRIAGITANNASLVKVMYEDYFDKKTNVNPETLTQSSPELQELQKGFVKFIENPYDDNFNAIHDRLRDFHDSLLLLANREAQAGAKLITFSEGLFLTPKNEEDVLIGKAKVIALKNEVYIALPVASLLPGKIEVGSKYMENKVVVINPHGNIEATFFKNKPVPVVEGSIAGDGKIPVVKTPFGNVALSICYDADFPSLMQGASANKADIMILPSGDWKEVSPFHARMAVFRAIENGFSLFRMVSGATSIATDFNGRILSSQDFYNSGERIMIAYLPTQRKVTVYSIVGDVFAWVCSVALVLNIVYVIINAAKSKRFRNSSN